MLDKFKKIKKGFTLTEIALVLSIAAIAGFIAFSQMVKQEEFNKAGMAGSQIKLIGDSVNAYISNHYDTLSSLTNSTGTSSDLGPRTCTASTNSCSITVATLVNEGLLPSTYSGKNVYGSGYNIILKRNGTSPYYKINGMVTTASSLITGSNIRYDLLGQAMQKAGIDSGMTRGTSTTVSGYNGAWTATSTDYSNINLAGILAYQAGYGTYNYSVFLRRDGTLPMTGDLNMGSQDINNAVNITASGATKSGTLESTGSTTVGTSLTVGTTGRFGGRVATRGYDPDDVPSTWGGGLRTLDVLGSGTLAVVKSGSTGASGNWAAYLTNNGNIWASNNVTSASTINAAGRITGGDIYSNSEIYATNWLRTLGDGGVYFQKYGGGFNMSDTATINAYGGKNIQTSAGLYGSYIQSSGNIYAGGAITSNGRLTANEFIQINGVGYVGNGCSPNGVVGRTSAGQVISCVNGVWRSPVSTSIYYNTAQSTAYRFPNTAAYCNGSDAAVGGGGYCSSRSGYIWITGSYPVGTNGWFVACDQNKSDDGNSTVTTFVKCQSSN